MESTRNEMNGKTTRLNYNSQGKVCGFTIEGDDGNEYHAHLGDIYENEQLLYKIRDKEDAGDELDVTLLEEGDEVTFDRWEDNKSSAIHVKKWNK